MGGSSPDLEEVKGGGGGYQHPMAHVCMKVGFMAPTSSFRATDDFFMTRQLAKEPHFISSPYCNIV
jgi:hypothetical protein